jgi:hypothetical protein
MCHEASMTLIRPVELEIYEIIDIGAVRAGIACDFGDTERAIDDYVALMIFHGSDFLPQLSSFDSLVNAYASVMDNGLAVDGEFNRDFLMIVLMALPDQDQGEDDPELAKRYLRTCAWLLKYYSCGVCDWQWSYSSEKVPSVRALLDVCSSFDSTFEQMPPMPRLANLALRCGMRDMKDMPAVLLNLRQHPRIGKYLTSCIPVDYDEFMEVFQSEILPQFPQEMLVAECDLPAICYERGREPRDFPFADFTEYKTRDTPVLPAPSANDMGVYQNCPAKILQIHARGIVDIEIEEITAPDLTSFIRQKEADHAWTPMAECQPRFRINVLRSEERRVGKECRR